MATARRKHSETEKRSNGHSRKGTPEIRLDRLTSVCVRNFACVFARGLSSSRKKRRLHLQKFDPPAESEWGYMEGLCAKTYAPLSVPLSTTVLNRLDLRRERINYSVHG